MLTASLLLLAGCAEPPRTVRVPQFVPTMAWATGRVVAALPVERLAGQLIMLGIENDRAGRSLVRLDDEHRGLIANVQPGAVVLFGQTFAGVDQVRALVDEVQALVTVPAFIATDYEGGLVSRLTSTGGIPATRIPSAVVVGRAVAESDERLARLLGELMGLELRSLGVTMNFAPVADVDPGDGSGAIGRHGRSYGSDPKAVGAIAAAVVEGLQRAGVAAVVKHFPGHGAVAEDSHVELPVLSVGLDAWRSREAVAFAAALEAGPLGLMTALLAAPALTGDTAPATLSPAAAELARGEFGFDGLLVTDAINMRALMQIAPEPELIVRAIEAGNDLLLKPLDPERAREAILEAVAAGRLTRARLEESVRRIFRAKRMLGMLGPEAAPGPDPAVVLGAAEHEALVARIRELAGGGE